MFIIKCIHGYPNSKSIYILSLANFKNILRLTFLQLNKHSSNFVATKPQTNIQKDRHIKASNQTPPLLGVKIGNVHVGKIKRRRNLTEMIHSMNDNANKLKSNISSNRVEKVAAFHRSLSTNIPK